MCGMSEEQLGLWPVHLMVHKYLIKMLFLPFTEYEFQAYYELLQLRSVRKARLGCLSVLLHSYQFKMLKYYKYIPTKCRV